MQIPEKKDLNPHSEWFVEQNGYEQGSNEDYNKEYAIDEVRLFRFLQNTQTEEIEKLGVCYSDAKSASF